MNCWKVAAAVDANLRTSSVVYYHSLQKTWWAGMSTSLPAQLAGPGTCAALRPNLPSPVAELCYAGQL